uniref:GNAT family N-acetyltransferase n=1 Tax=Schlesneria paludicola TaxID=360056 RepID=A0A7C4QRR0_9PLAN
MVSVRPFTAADIPFGMSLVGQVGWNQRAEDWRRMLRLQPDGGLVAEWEGRPAGTVMVCLFEDVAWVSMMLVDAALRRRGLGRRLMEHALQFAESRGAQTVRLDATPLGQPLYEQLGFQADFPLERFVGQPRGGRRHPVVPCDPAAAAEWDRAITGTNRRRLLELLATEAPCWRLPNWQGYITYRLGGTAVQIGPCVAEDTAGPRLLEHVFDLFAGETVLLDIPCGHAAARALAEQCGLRPQRRLLRMTRGARVVERTDSLWASFGPEKG